MLHSVPSTLATPIAIQATSDGGVVRLFLNNYYSPNTRAAYAADLQAFIGFVAMPLRAVTLGDVQAFAESLRPMAPASICRRLSAVKSLVHFAVRIGYLPFDVAAPVQLPPIEDNLAARILTEADVQRLLWLTTNPRDAALLRLLYGAGLRVSEACYLRWRHLTPRGDAGQISVFGKGGKTRAVLLPEALYTRVYALRGDAGDDDPVFRSRQRTALTRSQIHRIVKSAAKRARLPASVSAHFLRHAHVSHALDRGAPVHVVRATVGHASLETTTRYSHARPGDSSARYLNA